MTRYPSRQAREQAIRRGETTRTDSTLVDGRKHYAVARYDGSQRTVVQNLTGKASDNLAAAERKAAAMGPDHAAERIA